MKKINIIIVCTLAILSAGCSDYLDQDNRSNVSTDFYNTTSGYQSLRNSMYSSLRSIYTASPNLFVGGTDIYGDGKSQSVEMTYYSYTTSNSSIATFYSDCYKGIQLCNSVIAYGETTASSSNVALYMAEARFIRAWYYFQLVQQFGGVPLSNEMYTTAAMSHPRNTLKECYDFIISELTDLASSSALPSDGGGNGYVNKRAVEFFLAKAYLTRGWLNGQDYESQEDNIAESGDFQAALDHALLSINNEKPSKSIETLFDIANEGDPEFFWTVQYSSESVENPSSDGSRQMSQFGSYLGGSEYPLNKSIDGNYSPLLNLHQKFTRGDGRYEQTFMFELHGNNATNNFNGYFNYYTAKETTPIRVYYAPWWATDDDIEAWKQEHASQTKWTTSDGNTVETTISKTIAQGGIAPSNNAPASFEERRHMDEGTPCVRKFDDYSSSSIANRSSTCSMHDVSLARLGEAYLIAAEAYLKLGNTDKAAEMINTLRQRPGTIKAGYEEQMTVKASDVDIDFILDERARELLGEYVRWTDLKRTHKLFENIIKYQEDDVPESNLRGPDGAWKCLRPIPQSAIDLNKAEITQNPGY